MPKTKAKTKAKTKRIRKKATAVDEVVKLIKALKDTPTKKGMNYQGNLLNNSVAFTGGRGGYSNPYMLKSAEQKDSDLNRVPYQYQPAIRQQAKDDIKQLMIGYDKKNNNQAEQARLLIEKKKLDIAGRVAYDPMDIKAMQDSLGNISYELKGNNDRETKWLDPLVFNVEPPRRRSVSDSGSDLQFSKEDMKTIKNDKRFSKHSGIEDMTPLLPLRAFQVTDELESKSNKKSFLKCAQGFFGC